MINSLDSQEGQTKLKFHLLTHCKEFKRPSNTGNCVLEALGPASARKILWERVTPDEELLAVIASGKALLFYPDPHLSEDRVNHDLSGIEHIILLDGTWQEAKKIYKRSPYLQGMNTFSLTTHRVSEYNIRRNQREGGLCTAECVIEALTIIGEDERADSVNAAFKALMNRMVCRVNWQVHQ